MFFSLPFPNSSQILPTSRSFSLLKTKTKTKKTGFFFFFKAQKHIEVVLCWPTTPEHHSVGERYFSFPSKYKSETAC